MATALPAKLRGELQRFAHRASQLQQARPIAAYWCEYYILQQILAKGYHANDKECETYAVELMDKLETVKAESPTNDAIVDDVAAKAYMENFALDTFRKGDAAQSENRVTKQTADTFMAAATFLDLLSIWGEVDAEVAAKSKFAKFHAARILKAFRAGEDPNATNPVVEQPPAPPEVGMDAELQALERQEDVSGGSGVYRPPTVDSAPESGVPSRPQSTVPRQSAGVPLSVETPANGVPPSAPLAMDQPDVSPIDAPDETNQRQGSVGGGYFPSIPTEADGDTSMADDPPLLPPAPQDPQDFYNTQSRPLVDPSTPALQPPQPPPQQTMPSPSAAPWLGPAPPHIQAQHQQQRQPPAPVPPPASVPAPAAPVNHAPPAGGYKTDDESTMAAQKHARWAISALNFEDSNTAVKELRLALQSLGAT